MHLHRSTINTGSAFKYYDDGLEHSIWLSMMSARLEILRNLLSPDGAIFIHIDYTEEAYLKVLCDEIFGRNNFRNTIVTSRIKKNIRERELIKALNYAQDAILFYAKSDDCFIRPPEKEKSKKKDGMHWMQVDCEQEWITSYLAIGLLLADIGHGAMNGL